MADSSTVHAPLEYVLPTDLCTLGGGVPAGAVMVILRPSQGTIAIPRSTSTILRFSGAPLCRPLPLSSFPSYSNSPDLVEVSSST